MSAAQTFEASSAQGTGRIQNVVIWMLQIAAAAVIAMAGFAKLTGAPEMIGVFEVLGIGQWFRYATGAIEVSGALLLLIPAFAGLGALVLAPVMVGAVLTHLFVVGGSPIIPLVLLAVVALVAYRRREHALRFLSR